MKKMSNMKPTLIAFAFGAFGTILKVLKTDWRNWISDETSRRSRFTVLLR